MYSASHLSSVITKISLKSRSSKCGPYALGLLIRQMKPMTMLIVGGPEGRACIASHFVYPFNELVTIRDGFELV